MPCCTRRAGRPARSLPPCHQGLEGLFMDRFSRTDLRTLLANRQTPCVSLCIPTTRGPQMEDRTRWKNAVREAEKLLVNAGQAPRAANDFLKPAYELIAHEPFWLNVS